MVWRRQVVICMSGIPKCVLHKVKGRVGGGFICIVFQGWVEGVGCIWWRQVLKGDFYELFSKGWLQHMGNIGYFQHPPQTVGVPTPTLSGGGGGYTEWGGISGGRTYISHVYGWLYYCSFHRENHLIGDFPCFYDHHQLHNNPNNQLHYWYIHEDMHHFFQHWF